MGRMGNDAPRTIAEDHRWPLVTGLYNSFECDAVLHRVEKAETTVQTLLGESSRHKRLTMKMPHWNPTEKVQGMQ